MSVDTINGAGGLTQQQFKPAEQLETQRKAKESVNSIEPQAPESNKIQPEELLDQIKNITQDGLYSVRFEKDDEYSDLIVKIFDTETQEVIRQIPAEELISFKVTFEELVGNLVDTQS